MTEKFPIGAHVVYVGKSYTFPGEVTMRDDTGVVVKAFGDMDGNYTGMKHIYADSVLKPYTFGDMGMGIPPLVIFADENPMLKLRQWLGLHGKRPGEVKLAMVTLRKLFEELDAMADQKQRQDEETATQVVKAALGGAVGPHNYYPSVIHMGDCMVCGNTADSTIHSPIVAVARKAADVCKVCGGSGSRNGGPCPECEPETELYRKYTESHAEAYAKKDNLDHPTDTKLCNECWGSGMIEGAGWCSSCNGNGYTKI